MHILEIVCAWSDAVGDGHTVAFCLDIYGWSFVALDTDPGQCHPALRH